MKFHHTILKRLLVIIVCTYVERKQKLPVFPTLSLLFYVSKYKGKYKRCNMPIKTFAEYLMHCKFQLEAITCIAAVTQRQSTRLTLSQFRSLKIRRTTFLNYIKFADLLIARL